MKRNLLSAYLLLLLCFVVTANAGAQNLVINPGFENTLSCPAGISEFYLVTNWSNTTYSQYDTCTTPDLYAACSSNPGGVNIPNAFLGYHQAHSGTHFAGQILGDGILGCTPTGDNYREYLEGQLSSPLVAGQQYLVKFYMSLATGGMWGSNSYGVFFTDTLYLHDACSHALINVTPQVEMCGPAVMDSVNWVPVQMLYTATGGEQYFTMGNFLPDSTTNHVSHNCNSFNPYIYYYIDDVFIGPAASNTCGFTVATDSTNATCGSANGGASLTLYGGSCTHPSFTWSTGDTLASLSNLQAGTYIITVTDSTQCQATVSVTVNANSLSASLTSSNPGCGGNGTASMAVSNGAGPYSYIWSNGDTTSTVSGLAAGTYYVTVTGAPGCQAFDSVSFSNIARLNVTAEIV